MTLDQRSQPRPDPLAVCPAGRRGRVWVLSLLVLCAVVPLAPLLTPSSSFAITTVAGSPGQLNDPNGVAVDGQGNLVIAHSDSQRIRKERGDGTITTIAGTGLAAVSGDGPATSARLSRSFAVAIDRQGRRFITDADSSRIRKGAP